MPRQQGASTVQPPTLPPTGALHSRAIIGSPSLPLPSLNLQGSLFWQWYAPGETASKGEGGGTGRFGLYLSDFLFQQIRANAATTRQLYSARASRCTKKAPPVPAPCLSSYVNRKPGTG